MRRECAMATEKTDVVIVAVGAAGGILAAELGQGGRKVIGLKFLHWSTICGRLESRRDG